MRIVGASPSGRSSKTFMVRVEGAAGKTIVVTFGVALATIAAAWFLWWRDRIWMA